MPSKNNDSLSSEGAFTQACQPNHVVVFKQTTAHANQTLEAYYR